MKFLADCGRGAVLCAALLAGSAASAAPVTFNFWGVVTQTVFDPFDPLGGAVRPGSSFFSFMNFDSSAVDANPDPGVGTYGWSGGTFGFASVLGSVLFPTLRSLTISVVDGGPGGVDQYLVFASEGTPGGLNDYFTMSMTLEDSSGTAFSSDALPSTLLNLALFDLRNIVFSGQYTDTAGTFLQYEVKGNLAVSAPSSASLTGLGLLAAAFARRRGRSGMA